MRCEHVPGTIDGLDDLGVLRIGFEPAAQARDANVNAAVQWGQVMLPQELLSGQDLAGPFDERAQNLCFREAEYMLATRSRAQRVGGAVKRPSFKPGVLAAAPR